MTRALVTKFVLISILAQGFSLYSLRAENCSRDLPKAHSSSQSLPRREDALIEEVTKLAEGLLNPKSTSFLVKVMRVVGSINGPGWFYAQAIDPSYPAGEKTYGLGLLYQVDKRRGKYYIGDVKETFGFKIPEFPYEKDLPSLMSERQVRESDAASWMASAILVGQRLFLAGQHRYAPQNVSEFISQARQWTNVMEFMGPAFRASPQAFIDMNVFRDEPMPVDRKKRPLMFPHRAWFDIRFLPSQELFSSLLVKSLDMDPDRRIFKDPAKSRGLKLIRGKEFEEALQFFSNGILELLALDTLDPLSQANKTQLRLSTASERYFNLYDSKNRILGEMILRLNVKEAARDASREVRYGYPVVTSVTFVRR